MINNIPADWQNKLNEILSKDYFALILDKLEKEYQSQTIFPPKENLFNCFKHTSYENLKVIILGQDPYHEIGQANGLCFSVSNGVKLPPSLKNIFKELSADLGVSLSGKGDLSSWAKQGVLLLNTTLSVREGKANSHKSIGWQTFTDDVIKFLSTNCNNLVFLLWGNHAISKSSFIDSNRHLILTAPHPSPLSCYHGFLGCKHFSKCNEYLTENDIETIDWFV